MADEKQTDVPQEDGLSVKDAAKEIEGLLSDDDVEEILHGSPTDDDEDSQSSAAPKKKSPPKREPPKPDPDEDEDDDDLDDEDEDDDVDEDEVDGEDEDDDEVDDTPAPRGKLHRVKVDGEDLDVDYKELIAGYSRTSSFTKKSQALAEEKRQNDAAHAAKEAEITAARQHYVERLSALEEALASDEPDWDAVRRDNPEQFAELHAAWQVHRDRLGAIQHERQTEEAKLARQELANRHTLVQNERAKLVEAIPEWGDKTEKGAAFRRAIRDFGISQGFSAEELEGVADHRAFKILHQAHLYQQSLAKKKEDREKGKKKVDAIGQIKPGAKPASAKSRKAIQRQQHATRLKKTGNVRDAASLIESMLD